MVDLLQLKEVLVQDAGEVTPAVFIERLLGWATDVFVSGSRIVWLGIVPYAEDAFFVELLSNNTNLLHAMMIVTDHSSHRIVLEWLEGLNNYERSDLLKKMVWQQVRQRKLVNVLA